MSIILTDKQEKFCKGIVLFQMHPYEALKYAGYDYNSNSRGAKVTALLGNKAISDRIDELNKRYTDLDSVRKDIILEHQRTREFDILDVCYPVPYTDKDGIRKFRIEVKPVDQWSREARLNCTGFDRNGIPTFRDREVSTRELSRLFGLYKDNTVVVEQDLEAVYRDAMGIEEQPDVIDAKDNFSEEADKMLELDRLLDDLEVGEETTGESEKAEEDKEPSLEDMLDI